MSKYYMGIDTGTNGAFCVVDENGDIIEMIDMPLDNAHNINPHLINDFLMKYKNYDITVVVERMFCSQWTNGHNNAIWTQSRNYNSIVDGLVFKGYGSRYRIIECQQWQSKYIDGSADKQKSVDKAIELQPLHKSRFTSKRKIYDGRAESYLIALYGLEYTK